MTQTPLYFQPSDAGSPVLLAPMSGVTDRPFRSVADDFGPIGAVTAMVAGAFRLDQPAPVRNAIARDVSAPAAAAACRRAA